MSLLLFIQKIIFFEVVLLFFLIISGEHLAIEQLATTRTLLYFVVKQIPLRFLTSTASTRGQASLWAAVTLQQRMAGEAAMCMR
jgi:hypothetical protein